MCSSDHNQTTLNMHECVFKNVSLIHELLAGTRLVTVICNNFLIVERKYSL